MVACLSAEANAHAIHTTLTVATPDASGLSLSIRVFADDFSGSVARFAGRSAPADSSAPDLEALRYVRAHFTVRDANGASVALESCGMRRARELYWLCLRASLPRGARGVRLGNQMLTEWHSDQVNIVQVDGAGGRKTLLFTKGSKPSVLDGA